MAMEWNQIGIKLKIVMECFWGIIRDGEDNKQTNSLARKQQIFSSEKGGGPVPYGVQSA